MTIEKIKKIKSCKHIDLTRVALEVEIVSNLILNLAQSMQSSYHVHKVPVDGVPYLVADAKFINRHTNQSGRGNMRYLFDLQTKAWNGLAQEVDNGSYRRVT
jgi:hypothetical protein